MLFFPQSSLMAYCLLIVFIKIHSPQQIEYETNRKSLAASCDAVNGYWVVGIVMIRAVCWWSLSCREILAPTECALSLYVSQHQNKLWSVSNWKACRISVFRWKCQPAKIPPQHCFPGDYKFKLPCNSFTCFSHFFFFMLSWPITFCSYAGKWIEHRRLLDRILVMPLWEVTELKGAAFLNNSVWNITGWPLFPWNKPGMTKKSFNY